MSIATAIKNIIIQTIGFFIFTSSFFLVAVSKFINLYLDTVIVLNTITATYITAKYIHVFIHASFENTNVKLLISASNSFPTSIDMNCDPNIPTINPTINDIIPTNMVSNNIILEI